MEYFKEFNEEGSFIPDHIYRLNYAEYFTGLTPVLTQIKNYRDYRIPDGIQLAPFVDPAAEDNIKLTPGSVKQVSLAEEGFCLVELSGLTAGQSYRVYVNDRDSSRRFKKIFPAAGENEEEPGAVTGTVITDAGFNALMEYNSGTMPVNYKTREVALGYHSLEMRKYTAAFTAAAEKMYLLVNVKKGSNNTFAVLVKEAE